MVTKRFSAGFDIGGTKCAVILGEAVGRDGIRVIGETAVCDGGVPEAGGVPRGNVPSADGAFDRASSEEQRGGGNRDQLRRAFGSGARNRAVSAESAGLG